MNPSPRKTRKPNLCKFSDRAVAAFITKRDDEFAAVIGSDGEVWCHDQKQMRKLAAWLIRAADYLEQKQKGPK